MKLRRTAFLIVGLIVVSFLSCDDSRPLTYEVLAEDLYLPWNIVFDKEGFLWVCEQQNGVSKLNVETKELQPIKLQNFPLSLFYTLGLAIHPSFRDTPLVYIGLLYPEAGSSPTGFLDVVAAEYDVEKQTLEYAFTIVDSIGTKNSWLPGGRLEITKDNKLLVCTADEPGSGIAQDLSDNSGKILRYNLDGTIPSDNPFKGSPIFTFGHRNPQGLIVTKSGSIYSCEHGPSSDDEINEIKKGLNYGWPKVMGYCDEEKEMLICDSMSNIIEPMFAWTPTVAPSSLTYYEDSLIETFSGKFIMSTLKESDLRVLELNSGGTLQEKQIVFNEVFGRIRDLAIDRHGYLYFSTANSVPVKNTGFPVPKMDTTFAYDIIVRVSLEENEND